MTITSTMIINTTIVVCLLTIVSTSNVEPLRSTALLTAASSLTQKDHVKGRHDYGYDDGDDPDDDEDDDDDDDDDDADDAADDDGDDDGDDDPAAPIASPISSS